jgi:hypothetical protein
LSSGNVRGSVLLSRVEAAAPKGIEDRSHSIVTKRKPEQPAAVPADASEDQRGKLKAIGGSQSDEWNNLLAKQAIQALRVNDASPEERDRQLSAAIAALAGIAPQDELEGMMAAQLVAAHNAAMECYRRAMIGEQTFEGRRESLNQANKLSRTYATLLEALSRHRGKGQQKVTVEHVHVHSGGQAVVGIVAAAGGGCKKSEEQPHAKQIVHDPQPEMRRADPEREPVPVAGDAERPLPNARRAVAGRAEGK